MEPATDGKSLEKRLKVAALAWACTLTPPTGYEDPEDPTGYDITEPISHSENGVDIGKERQAAVDQESLEKCPNTNPSSGKNHGVDIKKERQAATADQKSLERRLKVIALAWGCTLGPPIGFEHPDVPQTNYEPQTNDAGYRKRSRIHFGNL